MNQTVERLLAGQGRNHILPFFWQHGETEKTLRNYMRVIAEAGCGAVCVESRPHPDFCGPRWWQDMDIILDEAKKRGMQVWILDDSHFPSGYANGAMEQAPAELCRQSVFSNPVKETGENGEICFSVADYVCPPKLTLSKMAEIVIPMLPEPRHFEDDCLLSVTAVSSAGEIRDLTGEIRNGVLEWNLESEPGQKTEAWQVFVNGLSRNCGSRRNYINMLDSASCQVLIREVYEPHYEHYKELFGTTIAGFFSDEPELGNGYIYMKNNSIGSEQDLPWSREVEAELTRRAGDSWKKKLPLLWDTAVKTEELAGEAARMRYLYMDIMTNLVKKDFSDSIGDWCRAHGVEYIGHLIEDDGQHCRTGASLGHYFRGLAGQDMAGIDDIGGQVMPGGEDSRPADPFGESRNGEFYHYGLGLLAASAAAIEPVKQGRAMCEIFGNYGWKEGVRLEQYLADHFLVRGINYFVPHAFSPKPYPDPDCPPHFYANGHNPQYRHFGELIRSMNRTAELLSGGHRIVQAAILYHAEAEWMWAKECMPFERVARRLVDARIGCDVLPADVFCKPEEYQADLSGRLHVHTQDYQILLIPDCRFLPAEVLGAMKKLAESGFPVWVVCAGQDKRRWNEDDSDISVTAASFPNVWIEDLVERLRLLGLLNTSLEPENNRVRMLHYQGEQELVLLVNEGNETYRGRFTLPYQNRELSEGMACCYEYDARKNRLLSVPARLKKDNRAQADSFALELDLILYPGRSRLLVMDSIEQARLEQEPSARIEAWRAAGAEGEVLSEWSRSCVSSLEYPNFTGEKSVCLPDRLAEEQPEFSGLVRYQRELDWSACGKKKTDRQEREGTQEQQQVILEITEASEAVEVFLNGRSLGIELAPPMCYDLTDALQEGKNTLTIEVATTLERERAVGTMSPLGTMVTEEATCESGLNGLVRLWKGEK